ncbi:hypothetical protein CCUS01_02502 [Colletotrichum cuscutae]|uniref:Uncharacterized protein n=1 Tax=Colletotrichum cuscutae TaxID=1209917 RepID=A0AAI9TYC8_9PEZI|nr:hypothetical protein CCUS01_02502 [Colletotrichum cuscutae]
MGRRSSGTSRRMIKGSRDSRLVALCS